MASRAGRRTAVTRFAGSRRARWRATSGRWISRVSSAGWRTGKGRSRAGLTVERTNSSMGAIRSGKVVASRCWPLANSHLLEQFIHQSRHAVAGDGAANRSERFRIQRSSHGCVCGDFVYARRVSVVDPCAGSVCERRPARVDSGLLPIRTGRGRVARQAWNGSGSLSHVLLSQRLESGAALRTLWRG